MAVLQRVAFYPQQRLDTPDARSLEAFSQNDWNYFLKGVFSVKSMVISGFEVSNFSNIFTVPGIKLKLNNVSLIHPEAKTSASGFYISAGNEKDLTLTLNPSATNFVEIDLKAQPGVRDVRAFWDMGAEGGKGSEFTDTVDTVINLDLDVTANVAGFTEGKIPLYKIITNAQGLVIELTDCRPMLFRLGTGGSSPDPRATAEFPPIPSPANAELENNPVAREATPTNMPFLGGDKNIKSLKQWMDIIMTRMKQMNATNFWYQKPNATPASVYQNAALTLLSGGTWEHITGTPGNLKLHEGSLLIRLGQNDSVLHPFASIDLTEHKCLYILLSTDSSTVSYRLGQNTTSPIIPRSVTAVTTTSITVDPEGNYISEDGKLMINGLEIYYEAYNDESGLFTGVTPDPTAITAIDDIVYQANKDSTGYYMTSVPLRLPTIRNGISLGAEQVFWLAYFDNASTIIIKDSELLPGESVQVGDDESDQMYKYIGSLNGADDRPIYDVNSIPNGTNLTMAIREAFKILETPIYDEKILDTDHTGWALNAIVYLPNNTKTNTSAEYTMTTDELEVYRDGALLAKGFDYDELTNNSIRLLRPVFVDSYLRFRISSVGGAGAAAGTQESGKSLQEGYNNGKNITALPGEPVTINGSSPNQEVLYVDGKISTTSPVKTTGTEFLESITNPIQPGKTGLWVDAATKKLFYTKPDGTTLAISGTLENLTGDAQNFKRSMQNKTGATIPAGSAVYIKGTREIGLADADDELRHRIFGFTAVTIPDQGFGDVIYQGVVPGLFAGTGIPSGSWMWLQTSQGLIADVNPGVTGSYQVIVGQVDGDDLIIQIQTSGQVG